jgi:hypothetical protein
MHASPQEGPREEDLSVVLLRLVLDEVDAERLRGMLSGFLHRCRNLLSGMKMSIYLVRREAAGPLPERLAEVEETFVAWRATSLSAGQTASLSWRSEGPEFEVSWEETSGARGCRDVGPGQGPPRSVLCSSIHSLGLPLLARMITAHHGAFEWHGTPPFQVRFRWPMTRPVAAECVGR